MSQVLTGHGGAAKYLHRFTLKADPWCVCEPDVVESILHILTECPRFAAKRQELELRLDTPITVVNRALLLTGKSTASGFAEYCERVVRGRAQQTGPARVWG